MLVAAHIPKRDATDLSAGNPLKIARTAPPIEYCDLVPTGTDQMDGSLSHYQPIFINPRSNEYLIILLRVSESFAG